MSDEVFGPPAPQMKAHWVATAPDGTILFHGMHSMPHAHGLITDHGHTVVSAETHAKVRGPGKWRLLPDGSAEPVAPPPRPLDQVKAEWVAALDASAERAREKISGGPLQAMTFAAKEAEARQFMVIQRGAFAYLSAEVGITGADLGEVAAAVVAEADRRHAALAAIEGARLARRKAILACASVAEIRALPKVDWGATANAETTKPPPA